MHTYMLEATFFDSTSEMNREEDAAKGFISEPSEEEVALFEAEIEQLIWLSHSLSSNDRFLKELNRASGEQELRKELLTLKFLV